MHPVTPDLPEKPCSGTGGLGISTLFSFSGRDGRRIWWAIQLFGLVLLVFVLLGIEGIDAAINDDATQFRGKETTTMSPIAAISQVIAYVVYGVAALATSVRRFHDRGKSGAWVFLGR